MFRRLVSFIEIIGTFIGWLLLFGPPSWQGVSRGVTITLVITIIISLVSGLAILVLVIRSQMEPPLL
jgi:hypothetical protein